MGTPYGMPIQTERVILKIVPDKLHKNGILSTAGQSPEQRIRPLGRGRSARLRGPVGRH